MLIVLLRYGYSSRYGYVTVQYTYLFQMLELRLYRIPGYNTAISAETIPSPTVVITASGSKFQYANVLCFTIIPFCPNIELHSKPAKLAEKVKLTAPILLAIARAIAAALVLGPENPGAARTIFVRRMVAPIFVPATLHITTPNTPIIHIVGYICLSVAFTSQWPKTSIQPWCARPSIRMNCENANGIKAKGSRGKAVDSVGKRVVK